MESTMNVKQYQRIFVDKILTGSAILGIYTLVIYLNVKILTFSGILIELWSEKEGNYVVLVKHKH